MRLHTQIYYEVEEGDTFLGIANKFDMTIFKLVELNPGFYSFRDANKIQVGELIRIQ